MHAAPEDVPLTLRIRIKCLLDREALKRWIETVNEKNDLETGVRINRLPL